MISVDSIAVDITHQSQREANVRFWSGMDRTEEEKRTLQVPVKSIHSRDRPPGVVPYAPQITEILKWSVAFTVYGICQASEGVHIGGSRQDLVQRVFRC